MSRWISQVLCAALTALIVTAGSLQAKTFQFKDHHEYPVEQGFKLSVSNTSGSIQISSVPGTQLRVEVVKRIDAASQEEADEIEDRLEVVIRDNKNAVEIGTRNSYDRDSRGFWGRLFGIHEQLNTSVSFLIEVPTSARIDVSTTSGDIDLQDLEGSARVSATSGDIRISGFTGDVSVENTSGDLSLQDIKGNIDANSTSSDMLFDSVTGDVDIQATSGNTELRWVNGSTRISKTSGDVRISGASGDVEINTTSGSIEVDQKEGSLAVSSTSGDVEVHTEAAKGERFEVETISGNIALAVPTELKGNVRLETVSGSINTDLALEVRSFNKHKLEGKIGNEGPAVILSTTSGDITLDGF